MREDSSRWAARYDDDAWYWGEWDNESGERWVRDRGGSWRRVTNADSTTLDVPALDGEDADG